MIRAYRRDPISRDLLVRILENAIRAPSAGHLQPWEFIVVLDDGVKKRLAEAALRQDFIAEAPVVVVVCTNTERSASRYGDRGRRLYSIIDAAYASLMILLTARDLGLGACFVGAFVDSEVSAILGLPSHVIPIGIIPIGYPAERPYKLSRIPLRRLVHLNRFGSTIDPVSLPERLGS